MRLRRHHRFAEEKWRRSPSGVERISQSKGLESENHVTVNLQAVDVSDRCTRTTSSAPGVASRFQCQSRPVLGAQVQVWPHMDPSDGPWRHSTTPSGLSRNAASALFDQTRDATVVANVAWSTGGGVGEKLPPHPPLTAATPATITAVSDANIRRGVSVRSAHTVCALKAGWSRAGFQMEASEGCVPADWDPCAMDHPRRKDASRRGSAWDTLPRFRGHTIILTNSPGRLELFGAERTNEKA